MYGVEGGLDSGQLEEQGRADWAARGLDAEEFTMARMTQIWNTEEAAKQREAENKNKLQEKLAKIQRQKERDFIPSKKQLGELVMDSWTNLKVGTKATMHKIGNSMELPFMRRARLQREHLARVLQHHTKTDELHQEKESARRTRRLERIHELEADRKNREQVTKGAPFRAHLQALEDGAAARAKQAWADAIKAKRKAYIDGVHAKQAARRKQVADRKAAELRRARAKADRKFARAAKATQNEHAVRSQRLADDKESKQLKKKADFAREQVVYRERLVTDELALPELSAPSAGGVFGVPREPDSYFRAGNQHDGRDDFTTAGGSMLNGGAPTGTAFEERQTALFELQAEAGRAEETYDDLRRRQLDAEDEISTLRERMDKAKQDITQSDHERKEFETELDGVGRKHAGRRFAYRHERKTVHQRTERRQWLVRHLKEMQDRVTTLEASKAQWLREELRTAQRLAVLRAEVSHAEQSQAREYSEHPQLPMVLGRGLNQVKGIREQIVASRDQIRETLVGSKFEILKQESKAAMARAKAMHNMNHAEWKAKIRHRDLKVEVELGESQLYAVVARLKEEMGKQRSNDVQGAVKKWWQNQGEAVAEARASGKGLKEGGGSVREQALALGGLRKVNVVHEGWLDWWSSRDKSQTAGIDQWNMENVQLGDATFGVVQGRISFPKNGLWQLELVVTKADELAANAGDPNDFCIVRLGTSAMSLEMVGKFYNVRAPGEAGVRYVIKKEITGQRFSYRFEMSSSSESRENHMMVTRGRFKQMNPPPLEQIGDDPNHVLSSYVKMQRIERKMGKARASVLLAELIKVERMGEEGAAAEPAGRSGSPKVASPGKAPHEEPIRAWFDTEVVNGFAQRFDRKHLARFLRDELKREMGQSRRQNEKQQEAAEAIRKQREAGGPEFEVVEEEDKFEKSEQQRLDRERARAQRVGEIETAKSRHKGGESKTNGGGGGSAAADAAAGAKKWPRFGGAEDGHGDDGKAEKQVGDAVASLLAKRKGGDKDSNSKARAGGDRRSVEDAPPDLAAAALDDESGSNPLNTDVLRRPGPRELLVAMRRMRRKRDAPPRKLSDGERKAKEVRLQDKLDRSQRMYLMRKRCGVEVDMEQARELVGQRLEIYFVEEARWRLGTVVDMRAEWSDGDSQLTVLHAVTYRGAEGAPTVWENMSQKRFVVLKSDLASVEAQRVALEEKRRLRQEQERRQREEFERRERILLEDKEEDRRVEADEMRAEMRADIARAIDQATREAVFVANTPAMDDFFEDQVPKITEEQKQGIGTEDGYGIFVVPKVAKSIAKKRFREGSVNVARREVRNKWSAIWKDKRDVVEKEREHDARMAAQRWRAERARQEEEAAAHLRQILIEKEKRKARLKIPNFDAALPPVTRCEHVNVKFWGTDYARGLRCKDCNTELTRSHEHPDQSCTWSGEVEKAVQWHRHHEHGAFRATGADQLARILSERLRLEKTRREMYMMETVFYDRAQMEGVEKMYQMHLPDIMNDAKELGDMLAKLTGSMAAGSMGAGEMLKLATSTEFGSSDLLTKDKSDIVDVVISSQPQTFMAGRLALPSKERDWDHRRRAAYRDLLSYYSRLNVFEKTLAKLIGERNAQLSQRKQWSTRLRELHAELVMFEDRMILVQEEHDRCEQMLKVRAVAQRKHDEAVADLVQAQGGYQEAVETRTTTEMAAALTEREHAELLNQVREMLVWRKWASGQVEENKELLAESRVALKTSEVIMAEAYDEPEKLNLCKRGEVLYLGRWGKAKVLSFRPEVEEDSDDEEDDGGDGTKKKKKKKKKIGGSFEQRAAAEAKRLADEKEEKERKEAEEQAELEANDPDYLFRWQCKFCGRKNGRHDLRCRGCDTKKPLRLRQKEEAWLEDRRKQREAEEEERKRKEDEEQKLKEEEAAKADTDKEGAWACRICGCSNGPDSEFCGDCGRPGRPAKTKTDAELALEEKRRKERAAKLVEPMPATLVLKLTSLGGPLAKGVWKLYTPLDPVVEEYRALRVAENAAMAVEDALVRPIYAEERRVAKEELKLIAVEDELMQYLVKWERWDQKAESERNEAFRRAAEEAEHGLLGLPDVKMELKETLEFRMADAHRKRDAEIKEWDGHGKKPAQYDRLGKWKLKKELKILIRQEYCDNYARLAEKAVIKDWKEKEINLREQEQSWNLMLELVEEFAVSIARDTFKSSMQARERAETDSGVVFSEVPPNPPQKNLGLGGDFVEPTLAEQAQHLRLASQETEMHHAVYMRLLRIQNARRAELREALDHWGRSLSDMVVEDEPEETEEQRLRREALERERAREAAERARMAEIEAECRKFYLDELRLCLRERWAMRDEEAITRALMAEEAELSKESKYDVAGSEPKKKRKTTKERRREALKKRNAERQRIKREMEGMEEEDLLGKEMQLEDMRKRQLEAMKGEQSGSDVSSSEGESGSDVSDSGDSVWDSTDDDELDEDGVTLLRDKHLSRSLKYYDTSVRELKEQMRVDRRAARKVKRRIKMRRKKGKAPTSSERIKLERRIDLLKNSIDLSIAMQRAVMEAANAELNLMRNRNQFFLARKRLFRAEENNRRIGLHSRKRNMEEQKLKRIARDQRALADEAAAIADEKELVVQTMVPIVRKLGRERKKVEAGTMYMDTIVLHGQPQRFLTDDLYKKLHWFYFYLLSQTIADRAELAVLERRLMELQYTLKEGTLVIRKKRSTVKRMRREHVRERRLRTRKSVLGKTEMFGKSQRRDLDYAFQAWRSWWRGHMGTKRAFELKQGLLAHEFDLRRVGRERREAARRKMHGGLASYTDDDRGHDAWKDNVGDWRRLRRESRAAAGLWNPKEDESVGMGGHAVREDAPVSLMKRHQRRWLDCRHCKGRYREGQNHAQACRYHPGVFKLACPTSCAFHGKKPDAVKCLAHYKLRWSCCESNQEGEFGSSGCDHRWHMPSKQDRSYRAQHELHKEEEDRAEVELRAAREDATAWTRKARRVRIEGIKEIVETRDTEHEDASRYKDIKWD